MPLILSKCFKNYMRYYQTFTICIKHYRCVNLVSGNKNYAMLDAFIATIKMQGFLTK